MSDLEKIELAARRVGMRLVDPENRHPAGDAGWALIHLADELVALARREPASGDEPVASAERGARAALMRRAIAGVTGGTMNQM